MHGCKDHTVTSEGETVTSNATPCVDSASPGSCVSCFTNASSSYFTTETPSSGDGIFGQQKLPVTKKVTA